MTQSTVAPLRKMRKTFVWFGVLGALCVFAAVLLGFVTDAITGDGAAVVIFIGAMGVLAGVRGWQLTGRRLKRQAAIGPVSKDS